MGRNAIDLTGKRFGRLVVAGRADSGLRQARWRCACDCGTETTAASRHLRKGMTTSCGCAAREMVPANKTHGRSNTPMYRAWATMWSRCTNPRATKYPLYGGRGIRVCDRWKRFENFLADMGERPPGMTLDRREANGHYEPGNCRWATAEVQRHNRRGEYPTNDSITHSADF